MNVNEIKIVSNKQSASGGYILNFSNAMKKNLLDINNPPLAVADILKFNSK